MLKYSRYLVTGGAGFIGSHLVERLVSLGCQVRVLDDFSTGKEENLSHLSGRVEIIRGDIRDREPARRPPKAWKWSCTRLPWPRCPGRFQNRSWPMKST